MQQSFDAKTTFDREAGTLSVFPSLTASVSGVLRVEADFFLEYSLDKAIPITDEAATAFGRMNGIFNVWPYWREYVQSTSMRTGLPPVKLSLMTGASLLAYYTEKDKAVADQICLVEPPRQYIRIIRPSYGRNFSLPAWPS